MKKIKNSDGIKKFDKIESHVDDYIVKNLSKRVRKIILDHRTLELDHGDEMLSSRHAFFLSKNLGFVIRLECKIVREINHIDPNNAVVDYEDPFDNEPDPKDVEIVENELKRRDQASTEFYI